MAINIRDGLDSLQVYKSTSAAGGESTHANIDSFAAPATTLSTKTKSLDLPTSCYFDAAVGMSAINAAAGAAIAAAGTYSVAFWLRHPEVWANVSGILISCSVTAASGGASTDDRFKIFSISSAGMSGIAFKEGDGAGGLGSQQNIVLDLHERMFSKWTFVAFTSDNAGSVDFYIDGSKFVTVTGTAYSGSYAQQLNIGGSDGYYGAGTAYIAHVSTWDTEISADDISRLWGDGRPGDPRATAAAHAGNLMGYWKFGPSDTIAAPGVIYDCVGSNDLVTSGTTASSKTLGPPWAVYPAIPVGFSADKLTQITVGSSPSNVGPLYVGGTSATSASGYPIDPGDDVEISSVPASSVGVVPSAIGQAAHLSTSPETFIDDNYAWFNGYNSRAKTTSNLPTWPPGSNGYSVSFWIKLGHAGTGIGNFFARVIYLGGAGSYYKTGFQAYVEANSGLFRVEENVNDPSGSQQINTASVGNISSISWSHIVFTSSTSGNTPGTVNLYMDARSAGAATASAGSSYVVDTLTIGASDTGTIANNEWFHGSVANVSWWNKSLTESEVLELNAAGRHANLKSLSFQADLAHWWRMFSGPGDAVSGSGNGQILDNQGPCDLVTHKMGLESKRSNPGIFTTISAPYDGANDYSYAYTNTLVGDPGVGFPGAVYYDNAASASVSGNYTVSFWLKPPASAFNYRYVVGSAYPWTSTDNSGRFKFIFSNNTSQLYFYETDGNGSQSSGMATSEWEAGTTPWIHVCVTSTSTESVAGTLTAYFRGAILDTRTGITHVGTWTPQLYLGEDPRNNVTSYTAFSICDLSMWSKALSPAEVQELYNGGRTFDLKKHSAAGAYLRSWYRFGNGVSSSGAPDVSNAGWSGYVYDQVGEQSLNMRNMTTTQFVEEAPGMEY